MCSIIVNIKYGGLLLILLATGRKNSREYAFENRMREQLQENDLRMHKTVTSGVEN